MSVPDRDRLQKLLNWWDEEGQYEDNTNHHAMGEFAEAARAWLEQGNAIILTDLEVVVRYSEKGDYLDGVPITHRPATIADLKAALGNAIIIQRSEAGWPTWALNLVAELVQHATRDGFVPLTLRYTLAADILDALDEGTAQFAAGPTNG